MKTMVSLLSFATLATSAIAGNFHGNPAHDGYVPADGPAAPALLWVATAPGYTIAAGSSPALDDERVYAYACGDSAAVVCFDRETGTHLWTAGGLTGATNSCPLDSWSSPVVGEDGEVYIGSGDRLYRVDGEAGGIVWARVLPRAVVNASPLVTSDLVAVRTYGGVSFTSSHLVVYSTTGDFLWQAQDGGGGANAPAYHAGVLYDLIYTATDTCEMRAYDAETGAVQWTSVTAIDDYGYAGWYGGIAYADGALYAQTYNFNGSAQLASIDTAGNLRWLVGAPQGDATPLVGAGSVITVGGSQMSVAASVSAYDVADGSLLWSKGLGAQATAAWRVSAVRAGRYVYVAAGDRLRTLNAEDGEVLHTSEESGLDGTPVVDETELYVTGNGSLYRYGVMPSTGVESWRLLR